MRGAQPGRGAAAVNRSRARRRVPTLPATGRTRHVVHATECLAGGVLSFLQRAVHELHSAGVRQTLVFSPRPDTPADVERLFPDDTQFVRTPAARGSHLSFVWHFSRALNEVVARQRPDAVHLHSTKAGFVGRLALRLGRLGARCYYSPHGLPYLNRRRPAASGAYWLLERAAAFAHHLPVACGPGEAGLLARLGRRPFVLENPVADSFFDIERCETQPLRVLSVGRLCEQKGSERFTELAMRFQIEEWPAEFVWVGAGEAARAAQLAGAGVSLPGWLGPAQLRDELAHAAVYVQTSHWEGMPLSLIEAMAAGLPAVVTDAVGNRDAIDHGRTGFVAHSPEQLVDRVRMLLADPALRTRMGEAARAEARLRFGAAAFRRALRQLYGLADEPAAALGPFEPEVPR